MGHPRRCDELPTGSMFRAATGGEGDLLRGFHADPQGIAKLKDELKIIYDLI